MQNNNFFGDGDVGIENYVGGDQININPLNEILETKQGTQKSAIQNYYFACSKTDSEIIRKSYRQQLAPGELLFDENEKDFSFVIFLDHSTVPSQYNSEYNASHPPCITYEMLQLRKTKAKETQYLVLFTGGEVFYTKNCSADNNTYNNNNNNYLGHGKYKCKDWNDAEKSYKDLQEYLVQKYGLSEFKGKFVIIKKNASEFAIVQENTGKESVVNVKEDLNNKHNNDNDIKNNNIK